MATTTNYGWETPDDTDLVKDGALAQRTTANAVDSTLGTALNNKLHAGLVLVKTQTIGTGVSSVTVTNAFNATYEAYKIVVTGGSASNGFNMKLVLGSANTGYYASGYFMPYTSTSGVALNDNNASGWSFVGYGMPNGISGTIELTNPFLTKNTMMSSHRTAPNAGSESGAFGGFLNNTTSLTDFTISTQSAVTMTGGTIYVYGYGAS